MNPSLAWDGMANLLVSEESRKEFASLRRTFDEVNHDLKTKFSQEFLIKERLPLVASAPPSSPSPMICEKEVEEDNESWRSGEGPWELILELVMWENAAKSSLWFGLGTMFFISSCFSMDVSFSMISAFYHLGLLILGLAFFYDSFPQRQQQRLKGANFKLEEEDILRVARLILPMANAALAMSQEVFSS